MSILSISLCGALTVGFTVTSSGGDNRVLEEAVMPSVPCLESGKAFVLLAAHVLFTVPSMMVSLPTRRRGLLEGSRRLRSAAGHYARGYRILSAKRAGLNTYYI